MIINATDEMEMLGQQIGRRLRGGEIIELVGDVGAGKTTFTRGLAKGLAIHDNITSPSFTINCNYTGRDGLTLRHYDFYRLSDPGIMNLELSEAITDPKAVVIIEWGDSIVDVLPEQRLVISINYLPEQGREVTIDCPEKLAYLVD